MPKHSSSGGNIDPQHNSIAAWIEVRFIFLSMHIEENLVTLESVYKRCPLYRENSSKLIELSSIIEIV
jgi:hypothetical protein